VDTRVAHWINAFVARLVAAAIRAPLLVVAFFAALTAGSLYGAVTQLGIDTDRADMLSAELPFRQHYDAYKRAFPQYVDTLLLVIEGQTPELARAAADRVAARLKRNDALFETVWRPGAGPFFERQGLLFLDVAELQELADKLAQIQPFLGTLARDQSLRGLLDMTSEALEAVIEGEDLELTPLLRALNEALKADAESRFHRVSWQTLMMGGELSSDARRQLILVQPRLDYSALLPAEPAMRALDQLAAELRLNGTRGVAMRVTGDAAMEYEEMRSVARGAGVGAALSFTLVTVVLLFGLRSPRLVIASMLTLAVSLALTAGFATLAVGRLNLISIAFAILNIGLGADYAIHLCLRYGELAGEGADSRRALRTGATHVGSSLVLAAATTAVGFYAFVPTAYAGVSELGLIAGTGLFIALGTSLSLLPALLALWPLRSQGAVRPQSFGAVTEAIAHWPLRHAAAIRVGALIVAAGAMFTLPFGRFDYNPLNLRDPGSKSVATFMDLVKTSDTPPWSATVLAPDAQTAARLADRLSDLRTVSQVVTLLDHVPRAQAQKLAIIDDLRLILGLELATAFGQAAPPSYAEQLAALVRFQAMLADYLAQDAHAESPAVAKLQIKLNRLLQDLEKLPLEQAQTRIAELERSLVATLPETLARLQTSLNARPVTLKSLPQALSTHWRTAAGEYRVEVFPTEDLSDSAALRRFVNAVRAVAPQATGLPVISLEAGEAVVAAFQQALAGALLVITILLWLLMRSLKDVALVLAPLLLGSLATAAVIVVTGGAFNFANIIVLPLLLGIGVDNGIHMVHRLRSTGDAYADLLRTSTARGVFYSALTTIVSFGNLAFSAHPGTASMGSLLTIGVLFTLVATLIVLPALLALSERRAGSPA
jgi:uncharacterized protein